MFFTQSDNNGTSECGQFNKIFNFEILLGPGHTISKNQPALGISIANFNRNALLTLYNIKRSIRIITNKILNKSHGDSKISFNIKFSNTL